LLLLASLSAVTVFAAALSASPGNVAMGIAQFQVHESASETSVIGLDAAGQEVPRLDLISVGSH
jgi:hypothetical protein